MSSLNEGITEIRERVKALQDKLYLTAKEHSDLRFYSLWDKVMREDVLRVAWEDVRSNRGAPGVDGQSIDEIIKEIGVDKFLFDIREDLRNKSYWVPSVRRVFIPKANGKMRGLGIPTVRDRVVQGAVKIILEPIFEAEFSDCSFGYRPRRSAKQASQEIWKWMNFGYENVLDGDISAFFDCLDHEKLMKAVERRVSDGGVLELIRRWLTAGIFEGGKLLERDAGTPQGGVISPLLANIYLDMFDRSFERISLASGRWGPKLVRYADDFVILSICPAQKLVKPVEKMMGNLGLKLNMEKTHVLTTRKGFNFLGFRFIRRNSDRKSKRINLYMPSPQSLKRVREKIRENVGTHVLHVLPFMIVKKLNQILIGWTNYFRHSNASTAFRKLQIYCNWKVRRYLQRRRGSKARARFFTDTYLYNILGLKIIASGRLKQECA